MHQATVGAAVSTLTLSRPLFVYKAVKVDKEGGKKHSFSKGTWLDFAFIYSTFSQK